MNPVYSRKSYKQKTVYPVYNERLNAGMVADFVYRRLSQKLDSLGDEELNFPTTTPEPEKALVLPLEQTPQFCLRYNPRNRALKIKEQSRPQDKPLTTGYLFDVPLRFEQGDIIENCIDQAFLTLAERLRAFKGEQALTQFERKLSEPRRDVEELNL